MSNNGKNNENIRFSTNDFKVVGRFWNGKLGYFILDTGVKKYRIEIRRHRKAILLGLNERPHIPKNRLDILINKIVEELNIKKKEFNKIRDLIEKEIWKTVYSDLEDRPKSFYRERFLNAYIVFYEDNTIRIFHKGDVYKVDMTDDATLTEKLYEIATSEGYNYEEASRLVDEFKKKLKKSVEIPSIVILPDGTIIRSVQKDEIIRGDTARIKLWVYGEMTKEGFTFKGIRCIVVLSDCVNVDFPEYDIDEGIVVVENEKLVENITLSPREVERLKISIKKCMADPTSIPSWREVYNLLYTTIDKYIGMDERSKVLTVLFIIHSYFYEFFPVTFYIIIVGESGSGKANLKDFISKLTRSVSVAQPTIAALYRIVNNLDCVVVIDETRFDSFLRLWLNVGNRRGTWIPRADKEDQDKIRAMKAFSPKVLVCQPSQLSKIATDTRNRSIIINMKRKKGVFEREVRREEIWPIIEKLYLLKIFRWKEYYRVFQNLDQIISQYLGGHPRDKWPHLIALAYLIGEDVLKKVLDYCIEDYAKREEFSELVSYVVNGILRCVSVSLTGGQGQGLREFETELMEVETEENGVIKLTSKAIVIVNEGFYDQRNKDHRSLVRQIGRLLKKGGLPFVVGFSREGTKGSRWYCVDLTKLYNFLKSYEPELPEDIDFEIIRENYGIDFKKIFSDLSLMKERIMELWREENEKYTLMEEKVKERKKEKITRMSEKMSETSEMSEEVIFGNTDKKEGEKTSIKRDMKTTIREEKEEEYTSSDVSDISDVSMKKLVNLSSTFGEDMAHKLSKILMELKKKEVMSLEDLLLTILFDCELDHIDKALEVVEKLRDEGMIEVEGDLHARDKTEVRVRYHG